MYLQNKYPFYKLNILGSIRLTAGIIQHEVTRSGNLRIKNWKVSLVDVASIGEVRISHIFVGNPKRKSQLGRHRRRSEDIINIVRQEMEFDRLVWNNVVQYSATRRRAYVNTICIKKRQVSNYRQFVS
jgi:hypothetical protein